MPFSRESSQPRDGTQISCIALPCEPPGKPKSVGTVYGNLLSSVHGGTDFGLKEHSHSWDSTMTD